MPRSQPGAHGHAVVLGASIAGLLTARVLADTYDRVTLVDRDQLDDEISAEPRRGVPQGRHAHGLLAAGLQVIEDLFPGATDELVRAGVAAGDLLGNVRFCPDGHTLTQRPLGLPALSFSRPLLESYLRGRVRQLSTVVFRDACDVVGLAAADGVVVGARIQERVPGSTPEVLAADLVVDATGRGSRAPRWLTGLGYPAPAEETLVVDLSYTSRHYLISREALHDDIAVVIGPTIDHPRGGAVQLQEQGRVVVTLIGMLGDQAPVDDEGFQAFAETLPLPYVADVIRGVTPIDHPVTYRYPGSTRHRYDRLRRFPAGFLVVGDALCSFNPMYGQGMSVAAVEARTLRAELERGLDALRFFRAVKPVIDIPWQIATGSDLVFPGVRGARPLMVRLVNRYLSRLYAAAEDDAEVSTAFIRVANLLAAPSSLLTPRIVRRVLRRRRAPAVQRVATRAPSTLVGPR